MSAVYICPMTGQLMRAMPGGAQPVPAGPGERPTPGATFVCHRSGRLMRVGATGYPEPADGGAMPGMPAPAPAAYPGMSYGGGYPAAQPVYAAPQPVSYGYPQAAPAGFASYGGYPGVSYGAPATGFQSFQGWR